MCIHLEIYEINLVAFCVFPLEYVFECFYCFTECLPCLIWFFVKILPNIYDQIKQKVGNMLQSLTKNNKPMETLQTKKT